MGGDEAAEVEDVDLAQQIVGEPLTPLLIGQAPQEVDSPPAHAGEVLEAGVSGDRDVGLGGRLQGGPGGYLGRAVQTRVAEGGVSGGASIADVDDDLLQRWEGRAVAVIQAVLVESEDVVADPFRRSAEHGQDIFDAAGRRVAQVTQTQAVLVPA